jgi:hypothetical protein
MLQPEADLFQLMIVSRGAPVQELMASPLVRAEGKGAEGEEEEGKGEITQDGKHSCTVLVDSSKQYRVATAMLQALW